MKIDFYNQDIDLPVFDFSNTNNWLCRVIEEFNFRVGEISIIFTSDKYLLDVNRKYLNHDYFTDIITFNYSSSKFISGDLFISLETVLENSKVFSVDFIFELHRVMVHGILHLIGFDDQNEQQTEKMRKEEDFWLKQISL